MLFQYECEFIMHSIRSQACHFILWEANLVDCEHELVGCVGRPAFPAVLVPCEPCLFLALFRTPPSLSRAASSAAQCCLKNRMGSQ